MSGMRNEKLPFGIASAGIGDVARQVSDDEPPPLPVNDALRVIGKPARRVDGRAKVTGAVRYTVDVKLPGMLHARIVRSASPHARVRAIDTAAAERLPGRARGSDDRRQGRHPALRGRAGRGDRGHLAGGGRRGGAAHSSRYRTIAVRRRHGHRAPAQCRAGLSARRTAAAERRGNSRLWRPRADRQCPRPGNSGQPGRRRARVRAFGSHCRRRIPHANPNALLHGAACHRRRLARRWTDRLHVDAVHRRRAPRTGAGVRSEAQPGAGEGRGHGRRLRFEVATGCLRPDRRHAVASGRRAGAAGVRSGGGTSGQRQPAGDLAEASRRRGARRHAQRDFAGGIWLGGRRSWRRRGQRRAGAVYVPEFRGGAERCVHQRRPRLGDARAGQYARRLRDGASDRRSRRSAWARSAGVARSHRSEPGAAGGAASGCREDRLGAPPSTGRGHRNDQTRPGRRAIDLGRQRFHQHLVRGARAARWLGAGVVERAGPRHRHRHDPGAGRGRGTRPAARGHHGAYRRHRLSGGAALVRQSDHGFDHTGGADGGVAGEAGVVSSGRGGAWCHAGPTDGARRQDRSGRRPHPRRVASAMPPPACAPSN